MRKHTGRLARQTRALIKDISLGEKWGTWSGDPIPFYVPESVLKFKTADKPIFDFKMKEWIKTLRRRRFESQKKVKLRDN